MDDCPTNNFKFAFARSRWGMKAHANDFFSSHFKYCTMVFFVVQLLVISSTTDAVDSLSNKIISIETETINGEDLLLIIVDTGIYDTRGSSDPTDNINPSCGNDRAVFIRLDAQTPTEVLELQLIRQALEAADIGPYRLRFSIIQDDCILFDIDTFPVANGVKLIQTKDSPVGLNIIKKLENNADEDQSRGTVSLNDTLTYKVMVTNGSRARLSDVVVSDGQLTPSSETCEILGPGESCVLTGTHVVTQQEVDAGNIKNTASASSSELPVPVTKSLNTPVPTFEIIKTLESNADEDGSGTLSLNDTLTYKVIATNVSGQLLTDVMVSDEQLTPSTINCDVLTPFLDNPRLPQQQPTAECVLNGTHIVTQEEVDAGSVNNTASVISPILTRPITDFLITSIP